MNCEVTCQQHEDYIHAMVTGKNTPEAVVQYMQDIQNECERRDCYRVLIEEKLTGPRLGVIEIFDLVATGSRSAVGVFEALAYVDTNTDTPDMTEFAETVAVNRGIPVAVFASVDDARNWLNGIKTSKSRKPCQGS